MGRGRGSSGSVRRHFALVEVDRLHVEQAGPLGLVPDRVFERSSRVLLTEEQVDRLRVSQLNKGYACTGEASWTRAPASQECTAEQLLIKTLHELIHWAVQLVRWAVRPIALQGWQLINFKTEPPGHSEGGGPPSNDPAAPFTG